MADEIECGCIAQINTHLKEYNAAIMVSLFGPPRAFVETYTSKKIRGKKTPLVYASFCPFCGNKYPPKKSLDDMLCDAAPAQEGRADG